jgi:hypothetical protein
MVSSLNNVLSNETKRSGHVSKHEAAALARGGLVQPWVVAGQGRPPPTRTQGRPGKPGHPARPADPAQTGQGNVGGRAPPGPPHSPATNRRVAAQAQCPHVRALCAAIPARSPLLPALTRSLRAASAFLTSLPHKAETVRSGTLQLYYTSKQTRGETNPETHWGETRNPPGPAKPRPDSRLSPQTPLPASPKTMTDPAAHMAEERGTESRAPRGTRACRPAPADVETAALRAADACRAVPAARGSLQGSRGTPAPRRGTPAEGRRKARRAPTAQKVGVRAIT